MVVGAPLLHTLVFDKFTADLHSGVRGNCYNNEEFGNQGDYRPLQFLLGYQVSQG